MLKEKRKCVYENIFLRGGMAERILGKIFLRV